jgi:probable HAF family extracellular repeat protein
MTDLGTLGGLNSSATGINSRGQVVGVSDIPGNQHRAFLWSGSMTDLGTLPGGFRSEAAAINASGEVVGYSEDASGRRPVIWQNGVIHDLNSFLPSGSGWTLSTATGHERPRSDRRQRHLQRRHTPVRAVAGHAHVPSSNTSEAILYRATRLARGGGVREPRFG